jgi:hypothetical protein
MSDIAYSYARYDGDSRSSWERLTWIEHSHQARTRQQRDDLSRSIIIDDPVMVSEEVLEQPDVADYDRDRRDESQPTTAAGRSHDQIDLDWRKWDSFDFVTVLGIVLIAIGFIAAFLPELRKAGVLVPVGLGVMTLGVLGAHRKDAHLS